MNEQSNEELSAGEKLVLELEEVLSRAADQDMALGALVMVLFAVHERAGLPPHKAVATLAVLFSERDEHSDRQVLHAAASVCLRAASELSFHAVREYASRFIAAIAAGRRP